MIGRIDRSASVPGPRSCAGVPNSEPWNMREFVQIILGTRITDFYAAIFEAPLLNAHF